jgi:hypothetical protein
MTAGLKSMIVAVSKQEKWCDEDWRKYDRGDPSPLNSAGMTPRPVSSSWASSARNDLVRLNSFGGYITPQQYITEILTLWPSSMQSNRTANHGSCTPDAVPSRQWCKDLQPLTYQPALHTTPSSFLVATAHWSSHETYELRTGGISKYRYIRARSFVLALALRKVHSLICKAFTRDWNVGQKLRYASCLLIRKYKQLL